MLADMALIADIEDVIAHRAEPERSRALSRVTDLFVAGAALLNEEHVSLFDDVIMRLASEIEQRARAETR